MFVVNNLFQDLCLFLAIIFPLLLVFTNLPLFLGSIMAVILHFVKVFLSLLILYEYLKQYRMDEEYLIAKYVLFYFSPLTFMVLDFLLLFY